MVYLTISFFKLVKTLEVGKIAIVQNNSRGNREIIKISKLKDFWRHLLKVIEKR